jgi:hypothetical protein
VSAHSAGAYTATSLVMVLTINVPVVFMGRYEVVLRGDYP